MAANTTTLDAILKNDYLPPIRKALNDSSLLWSRLERDEESVVGKMAIVPINYAHNQGVGAQSETGVPTAGEEAYKESQVAMKYIRGRISVSSPVIEASKNDAGAFVRAVDSEMRGLEASLRDDMNRQVFGDGTGKLAQVNGAVTWSSGTATVTVDNPGTLYLKPGMLIDIYSSYPDTKSHSGVKVESVNSATSFTISAGEGSAANIADNAWITRKGAVTTTGVQYEIMGLKGLIDDGTYVATLQNIARSTASYWKANVLANGGTNRALTLELMQQAQDEAEVQGAGLTSLIVSNFAVRRKYINLLAADKRFVQPFYIEGGWPGLRPKEEGRRQYQAVEFNGIPYVADRYCPGNTMFFVDESTIKVYRLKDFDWMDEDGSILHLKSGSAEYEAVLELFANLGIDAPLKNSVIRDISES
ncbi:MAG: phage major capsid protein [Chloroflexi bacterium]|nr:phage major capsid protein [Chloroflexota bacterium]